MPAGGEGLAVPLGRFAVPVEVPVLQLDPGALGAVGEEQHLHLAGPGRVRHRHPVRADLPDEDESARRVPGEHPAPVGAKAVRADLVEHAAGSRLHAQLGQDTRAGPGVFGDPPLGQVVGEDRERVLGGAWDEEGAP